jgi:ankyrin repeat protein
MQALPCTVDECLTLIRDGADVNAKGPNGHTALWCAAQQGRIELCELFVATGAVVNETEERGVGPLCVPRRTENMRRSHASYWLPALRL